VSGHVAELTDRDAVADLVAAVAREHGPIDVLVNNAGMTQTGQHEPEAPVGQLAPAAWDRQLAITLTTAYNVTHEVLGSLVGRGWGRIINISSVEGKQGNKPAVSHYITNKHAINGLTKAVATEYGTMGITCNAICPGAIETDTMRELGPQAAAGAGITYQQFLDNYAAESAIKRLNTVEEVAAMATLLASELGAGITGSLINVDGGTSQW
jgi:3-hydroxybutyrate dehydrogenase/3-oxoacyl-[acyl-carrier protein] reductase